MPPLTTSISRALSPLLISLVLSLAGGYAMAAEQANQPDETTADQSTATADQQTAKAALKTLQDNQAKLNAKQNELRALDEKINTLSQKHASATNEAELAADQLAFISQRLNVSRLQYQQTTLSIQVTQEEITKNQQQSQELTVTMEKTKQELREILRSLYRYDQLSFLDIVLGSKNLSTLMSERRAYRKLQQKALDYVNQLQSQQQELTNRLHDLEASQQEMQQLKKLQARQQADLSEQQEAKAKFLKLKQQDQAQYAREIAETKQTRAEIERDIFSLQGIGIELALNDAFSSARFASSLTGVRPALLLGIVKVETNVGESLGSGKFPDDMHPASREAFLRLMEKLGRDPNNTPISRRPTSYQGWGGAIGPGQFMPDTWERLMPRVSALMKKPVPDPFELTDALVAIGIMMADRGATDPNKEVEAVARYLAGPNWQYHLWYSTRVLAVAAEYEKEGLK